MRERLILLRERRMRLLDRAAQERARIAAAAAGASAVEPWIEAARRGLDEARRRPLAVLAVVALLVAARPRRMLSLALKGWSAWQVYRRARALVERLGPDFLKGLRGA